jgi:transcriptional regulator CtsR
METLFAKTKIAHGRRIFSLNKNLRKKLTSDDFEKGFIRFLENDEVMNRRESKMIEKAIRNSLYV